MQIADSDVPKGLRVFKRGNATCVTEGVYSGIRSYVPIDPTILPSGSSCFFLNCFVVSDLENSAPFFGLGDSGSGVFVLERTSRSYKALGIAFARQWARGDTFVCKLNEISRVFQLSLSDEVFATENNTI